MERHLPLHPLTGAEADVPAGDDERARSFRARWSRRSAAGQVGIVLLALILAFLVVYPIGILLLGIFSKSPPQDLALNAGNFTLDHVRQIAGSSTMRGAIVTSFVGAVGGTAVAMAIATFFAWVVARTNVRHARAIELAALVPLLISPLVAGIAWARIGYPHSGILNTGLHELGIGVTINIGSLGGIVFVMGLYYAPYAYLLLIGSLRNIDPSLEEAAASCGASGWQTVRRIVLPLMAPAIYSAVLLVLVTLLALYAIPFLLGESNGVEFMTTYLYRLIYKTPPDYQGAATVGLLLTVVVLVGVVLQRRVLGRRRYATVTGKAFRPRLVDVGRWRYLLLAIAGLYILVAAVIPYLVLAITAFRQVQFFTSFANVFSTDALSLQNLHAVLDRAELSRSITNGVIVGVGTAVIGVVLCFLLAYTTERTKLRARGVLRAIITVPVAIPGLIIGVAFLWAWIGLPIGIYGTIWIVILAFVARHLPDGHRAMSSTMLQVHDELEEAARVCGASWVRTTRTVLLPLIRGGLLSAAILLFVFSVREVGPALFLVTSHNNVLSVQVIQSWASGDIGGAAMLALIQSVILLVVVGVARVVWRVDLPR